MNTSTEPKPNREALENEDKYSQVYIHGQFHTFMPTGMKLKDMDKKMKAEGYYQTGFKIGGCYMKVNYAAK